MLSNKLLSKKRLSKELKCWLHTIKEVEETLTLARNCLVLKEVQDLRDLSVHAQQELLVKNISATEEEAVEVAVAVVVNKKKKKLPQASPKQETFKDPYLTPIPYLVENTRLLLMSKHQPHQLRLFKRKRRKILLMKFSTSISLTLFTISMRALLSKL